MDSCLYEKEKVSSVFLWLKLAICLYFVISVFEPYLTGVLGSVTKYYILLVSFLLLLKNNFFIRSDAVPYIVWLVYKVFTLFWSKDLATPKLHFLSQVGMVLFFIALLSQRFDLKTLDEFELSYFLASGVLGLLSLFLSNSYLGTAESRQVIVVFGIEEDPNNQAAFLIVGICLSLSNILYKKKFVLISVLILLINSFACFKTGSRAGLVTLVFLIFLFVCLGVGKNQIKSIIKRFLFLAMIIAVLYFIILGSLPESVYQRLFVFSSYSGGSGRVILWRNAWSLFTRDLLTIIFGAGWGTATISTGLDVAVHNTFLTMLCDVGLFGTLLFFCPIIGMSFKLIKKRQIVPVYFLLSQFIPSFFIDSINKRFFWNAIFLFCMHYVACCCGNTETKSREIKE